MTEPQPDTRTRQLPKLMPRLPDRRMLSSAAVVGAILVGGVAVAGTASAGFLDKEPKSLQKHVATPTPSPSRTAVEIEPGTLGDLPPGVVVNDLTSVDPNQIASYWTDDQLENAKPMPVPEIEIDGSQGRSGD
jgi:hypothetical protein